MKRHALIVLLGLSGACSPTTNNFSLQSDAEDAAPESDGGLSPAELDGSTSVEGGSAEDAGEPPPENDGGVGETDAGDGAEPDAGDVEPPIAPCFTSENPVAGTWRPDFTKDKAVLRFDFGGADWMVEGAGCDLEVVSMTILNRFLVDDYSLQYILLFCDSTPVIRATPVDKCLLHDVDTFDVEITYRKI